jgi:hypothetical protein
MGNKPSLQKVSLSRKKSNLPTKKMGCTSSRPVAGANGATAAVDAVKTDAVADKEDVAGKEVVSVTVVPKKGQSPGA